MKKKKNPSSSKSKNEVERGNIESGRGPLLRLHNTQYPIWSPSCVNRTSSRLKNPPGPVKQLLYLCWVIKLGV